MKRTDVQGRRLCTAHRTDGKPCRAPAVKGATVCINHGAAKGTPGRDAADRLILADLVGPALMKLRDLLNDDTVGASVQLRAAIAILDRSGNYGSGGDRLTVAEAEAVIETEVARLGGLDG